MEELEASRRRIEELERELRETRERSAAFTRIVESIDHHVYINEVLPGGGRRTLFSGPGRDKLLGGVPADGDWGRAWIDAIHPDDRALYAEHTAKYLRGEMSEVRCRLIGLDGVTRWICGGGMPRWEGERLIVEGIVRDATAEVGAEERLREAARTDALTGIFNRRHFSEVFEAELERSRREDLTPGVLLIDVDHFKAVNDSYGHQVGDAVLIEIATRLRSAVRSYHCVARWGGEEFIVLAPALADERALWRICEAVRQSVGQRPIVVGARRLDVTVSVGAVLADPMGSHELIVEQADRALYAAKRLGRDRARLFSELTPFDLAAEEPEAIRLAQALSLSAGVREGVPEQHAEEVAELAGAIASGLALPEDVVLRCRLGGWLHDIGKVAIPDRILVKPESLDEHEWRIMRTHAEIGEQLVRRIPAVGTAALTVRHHHERVDGSGYPDALAGEEIPIEARIVAVADAYSAITADRPYRRARSRAEAVAELRAGAGRHHDGRAVEALVTRARRRPGPASRGLTPAQFAGAAAAVQFARTTVQRPPCAWSSVNASGAASMRQNASSGAPSACTTAALTTSPCVMAATRPSRSACASSQRAIRVQNMARLSPPCGAESGSSIQARTASGSLSLTSASVRPAQVPKSHSAIASSTLASSPAASAVWRQRRAGLVTISARRGSRAASPAACSRPRSSSGSSAGNADARVADVGACRTSSNVRIAQLSSSSPAAMRAAISLDSAR